VSQGSPKTRDIPTGNINIEEMSLRGRKFFDVLRHHPSSFLTSSRFRLPCPPYHDPDYWARQHRDMSPDDVHEWGGFDLNDGLLHFRYETLLHHRMHHRRVYAGRGEEVLAGWSRRTGEGGDAVRRYEGMQCRTMAEDNEISRDDDETILLIGCGNSKVGEQILTNSFVGPVIQIDISPRIIRLMTQRYEKYFREASVRRMELIVDDAGGLTSLGPESVGGGVLDKGLLDALHCSTGIDDDDAGKSTIRNIVDSVHRVLRPSHKNGRRYRF
ncbi:hypothetical protein ACHAXA_007808, partial [Cyclostephanos tholiformis]